MPTSIRRVAIEDGVAATDNAHVTRASAETAVRTILHVDLDAFFVEAFGYEAFFALSAASIVPTLWLYWRLRPHMEQPPRPS